MKLLVYGFGALGLYFAYRFTEAGYAVTVVDPRRDSPADGDVSVRFEDGLSGLEHDKSIRLLSELPPDESFALAVVTLPSHHIEEQLHGIASITQVRRVLLVGGYVSGMDRWAETVGEERTVFAYPGMSAYLDREEMRVVFCDRDEGRDQRRGITVGTLGGKIPEGAGELCHVFTDSGIPVNRSDSIRAVFLSQAAIRLPMTAALLFAGGSLDKLTVRGDLLKLMIQGIREALAAVRSAGYELSPPSLSMYRYVPIFIIANMMKGQFDSASSRIGIEEAGMRAGGEPIALAGQFLDFVEETAVREEHLRYLFSAYFDEEEPE
jgi:ketopantoate reductase